MSRRQRQRSKQWTVGVMSFRSGGSYPYFKSVLILMVTFMVCTFLMVLNIISWVGFLVIVTIMGTVTVVFGLSPALTEQQIGSSSLILRHGWYFQAKVPLDNIRDVDETEEGVPGHGVNFLLGGSRLYITNSRVGLVRVKLHDRQMIGGLFGRFITDIVMNVDEPGPFVRTLRERAGLRPKSEPGDRCPSCGQEVQGPDKAITGRVVVPAGPAKPAVLMIELIFLVHNDGRLIASYKSGRVQTKEAFSVMGMFTAIQDFVKDAFKRTDGNLRTLEHGNLKVLLEPGRWIYLAVVIEGGEEPAELRKAMRRALKEVEAKFGHVLDDKWDGELTNLGDLKKILAQVLWT